MTQLLIRHVNGVFLFFLLFISQSSFAFNVNPRIVELSSVGKTSNGSLQVINDSKEPLPIEIVIYSAEVAEDGTASKTRTGDEFLVFPPQSMIAAGATQNFKIKWVGAPDIKKSQHYIFSVNQIPVKPLATKDKKVEVVFNYSIIVNVRPEKGTSELNLIKTEIGKDKKGILRPILTIKNSKNIHARLSDASIHLSSGDWSKKLSSSHLAQTVGIGLVPAGKTRRFILKVDIPKTFKSVEASIDYKPL